LVGAGALGGIGLNGPEGDFGLIEGVGFGGAAVGGEAEASAADVGLVEGITGDGLKAVASAAAWHNVVRIEYGTVKIPSQMSGRNFNEPVHVAAAVSEPGVQRWLVDTGCPYDFIANRELDSNENSFIRTASKPIRMSTPSGMVDANRFVFMYFSVMDPLQML
jgi:hypothetical protein